MRMLVARVCDNVQTESLPGRRIKNSNSASYEVERRPRGTPYRRRTDGLAKFLGPI